MRISDNRFRNLLNSPYHAQSHSIRLVNASNRINFHYYTLNSLAVALSKLTGLIFEKPGKKFFGR